MSSIKLGCFCLYVGYFINCSCLDVEKCSKCHSERRKETEPPKARRGAQLFVILGIPVVSIFVSKQDAEVAQQPEVPNTEKSAQWTMKFFGPPKAPLYCFQFR